jgi:hypothetical protein
MYLEEFIGLLSYRAYPTVNLPYIIQQDGGGNSTLTSGVMQIWGNAEPDSL